LRLLSNPYQFTVKGTGTGNLHCVCPATGGTDLCRGTAVNQ
jgi:hypothetical protein